MRGLKLGLGLSRGAAPGGLVIPRLFAGGTNGVWYDPSDFSTMFQDSAGTTPVTVVGKPVGLVLDKSKNLALGSESWIDANATFAGESTRISPNVYRIYSSGGSYAGVTMGNLKSTAYYKISFTIDSVANAGDGVVWHYGSTVTPSYTTAGPKTFYLFGGATNIVLKRASTAVDYQVSGISIREITGNHAIQATSTKRPILQQDANGKYYLAFDGVDDFLVTAADLNMSASDEVSVFAGLQKKSDTLRGAILYNVDPNTVNGAVRLLAPYTNGSHDYNFAIRGTAVNIITTPANYAAPNKSILSCLGKISTDLAQVRINAQLVINANGIDLGTGNFFNTRLFIGSVVGSGDFFNGDLYALVIANKNYADATVLQTEAWINQKTGAY